MVMPCVKNTRPQTYMTAPGFQAASMEKGGVGARVSGAPAVVGGQPRAHADRGLHSQPRGCLQQRGQLRVLLQDDNAVDAQLPAVEHL